VWLGLWGAGVGSVALLEFAVCKRVPLCFLVTPRAGKEDEDEDESGSDFDGASLLFLLVCVCEPACCACDVCCSFFRLAANVIGSTSTCPPHAQCMANLRPPYKSRVAPVSSAPPRAADVSDFDEDDDDDDTDAVPPGCDQALYDKVIDLREKRLDQEEVLADFQRAVDDLRKAHDRHSQRLRQVECLFVCFRVRRAGVEPRACACEGALL
jgi:hypothetical protein